MNRRNLQMNNRIFDNQVKHSQMSIVNRLNDFDKLFEAEMQMKNEPKRNYLTEKQKNKGEITGNDFSISKIDQGMPLRSQTNFRRNDETDLEESFNKRLDFSIFDEEQDTNTKGEISYFDPSNGTDYDFNNFGKEESTTKLNPLQISANIMNDYGFFINENFRGLMTDNNCIMVHSIVQILESLYLGSKGNSSNDLKNYLNFVDKETIYNGSTKNIDYIKRSQCYDFRNIILLDKSVPINSRFIEYVSPLVLCFTVNKGDAISESQKLNKYVNSMFNNVLGQLYKPEHIQNIDVSCLSVGIIRTIWKTQFDKVITGIFNGKSHRPSPLMLSVGRTFPYYEDNNLQMIEMDLYDNSLTMGFILPKSIGKLPKLNYKDYKIYSESMKPCVLDEVVIPQFKIQSKLRIANVLVKTGLQNLFTKLEVPELLGKQSKLTDFVQNIIVLVDQVAKPSDNKQSTTKSGKKFLANRPFYYYVKLLQSNSIILIGQYYG
jgi:serine protease inhibitor